MTETDGGESYHLSPTCGGLRQAGVMRTGDVGSRRLCELCAKVEQLPLRGAPLSAAGWAPEAASLIEDVVSATLSAREAEAFLRWLVGDPPFWV